MEGWEITYKDGTTFSSGDGPWSAAPDEGVLFVVIYTVHGVLRLQGHDFYWVNGQRFGNYVAKENLSENPGGPGWTWLVRSDRIVNQSSLAPPVGTHVLAGAQVSDEEAAKWGLI